MTQNTNSGVCDSGGAGPQVSTPRPPRTPWRVPIHALFPQGKPEGDVSGVTPKDAASWCRTRTPWPTLLMSSEDLRPVVRPYFIALGQPCRLPRRQVPLRRGRTLQPASSTTAACARVCNYHNPSPYLYNHSSGDKEVVGGHVALSLSLALLAECH